jgi:flagellum-specific ATP synthase
MMKLQKYQNILEGEDFVELAGKIKKVVGLTVESRGPEAAIGDLCTICTHKGDIPAEVVGFSDENLLLMPFGSMKGIGVGSKVISRKDVLSIKVGEDLIGRVLDGLGEPIDGLGSFTGSEYYPVDYEAPHPLERNRIREPLQLGIKAIDGLLSIGKGQRMGIFAGSGVGKSTLLGMIARNTEADVNVVALIGERGREVKEFLEKDLGEEGLKRSVVVVATSDQPAMVRLKAAFVATSIAEYFRNQGKDVLLMMDSLTRFAMAQREIGLAIGEPPVTKGYPPSVFGLLPTLLERAGNDSEGTITGIYTVLVDGDDFNEPVTDAARGILDGHILLSRKIANQGRYPAIDVLGSISRVMNDIVKSEHKQAASVFKGHLATYLESEDLINIGAYVQGSNSRVDKAISKIETMNGFLAQGVDEHIAHESTIEELERIMR